MKAMDLPRRHGEHREDFGAGRGTRVCVATRSRGHKLCEANHPLSTCCARDTQKLSTRTDSYTPVVTGSMHNRVRPKGIEAPRGACDGASKGWRGGGGTPTPGVFVRA